MLGTMQHVPRLLYACIYQCTNTAHRLFKQNVKLACIYGNSWKLTEVLDLSCTISDGSLKKE